MDRYLNPLNPKNAAGIDHEYGGYSDGASHDFGGTGDGAGKLGGNCISERRREREDCGGFSPGSRMAVTTSATLCCGCATGFGGPVDSMEMNYDERVSPRLLKRLTK